jgi:hypothetical protein
MTGTTCGEVITKVNRHLESNGFDAKSVESLEREIEDRICQEVPTYCGSDSLEIKPLPRNRGRTIHEVISGTKTIGSWLLHRVKGDGNATAEEAEERAKICVICAENTEPSGCTSCNKAASERVLEALVPFRTSKDAELKSCRICGCFLKAKICVSQDILEKNMPEYVKKELPGHCWLSTGNKNL